MPRNLFLLDGMALVYRAHFALIQRPILTSQGVNTSALYGFTQTVLDLLETRQPTHMAVVFDTPVPTRRHEEYPEYKAQREAMPEDLSAALPHVRRMTEALRIAVLSLDGYEADDIIGTLVQRAEREGFTSTMVTPDKDFGQLVTPRTALYRPGRLGSEPDILGPEDICKRWNIAHPRQVVDVLGLMGDASDNIPGVPGIGEKTAAKLIQQYGSVEVLLEHLDDLKGKQKQNLATYREQALLSKRLAQIDCDVPIQIAWEALATREPDPEQLKTLLMEFEFNSIGRRLLGESFRAGRGFAGPAVQAAAMLPTQGTAGTVAARTESSTTPAASLKRLADAPVRYESLRSLAEFNRLAQAMKAKGTCAFAVSPRGGVPRLTAAAGVAFCVEAGAAHWVALPSTPQERQPWVEALRDLLEEQTLDKTGHDLKADLAMLRREGIRVRGPLYDVMLAHALTEPELRHSLEYLAESRLGYAPLERQPSTGQQPELSLDLPDPRRDAERAMEQADLALQLREVLTPALLEKQQERVFHDIEMPLVPVLVELEHEGVKVDAEALRDFAGQLSSEMAEQEQSIQRLAGTEFNVNSPKQLGEVLFDRLRLVDSPRKTRTGQYATDEQTLMALANEHEIVRRLLDYRTASKLKSTYADALPAAMDPQTGRVHTTFQQLLTATGRLSSQNPNLQNIPIRTELGQEIRRAFVPSDDQHLLLSADYSQIELRIIAALSREAGLLEAFRRQADVHTATAARVFGVPEDGVTPEMRKKAKMVNYGIAYGISAFGLAQRLGISRKEAAGIIEHYFAQFSGIRDFMKRTIEVCRERGYVETVTGRRRYVRDVTSANGTIRAAAERNAINAPIQGSAADMIKIAMVAIHRELCRRRLRTRMLLQVHDELLFDLFIPEQEEVRALVEERMRTAIALDVPIVVELGVGRTWLEAH